MYSSVKDWIDVPVEVKPFVGRTGTGDKIFGSTRQITCYPQGEVNIVRNWQGVEVVSHTKLYVDGDVAIGKFDTVIFEDEEKPVQAISSFYRDGKPDIKVVYI